MELAELKRREQIVVDECDGILPHCRIFYVHSIAYAADRALEAFRRFETVVQNESHAFVVTSAIHEALSHAASLSRFFWPSRDEGVAAARARSLRAVFGVDGRCPLRDRMLRNALEHFDERLDRYLLIHDCGHFFPDPMVRDHSLADEPTANIFKLVDPAFGYFVILGEKYAYGAIMEEAERILTVANKLR